MPATLWLSRTLLNLQNNIMLSLAHTSVLTIFKDSETEDYEFSAAIAKAVKKCSQWLVYYGATGENIARVESELNVKVAKEVFLNKIYNADGSIDYSAKDIVNTETSITRLKQLLAASQVYNNEGGKTYVEADTIHFSSSAPNAVEVLREARNVITPLPINYKNVCQSGWVE